MDEFEPAQAAALLGMTLPEQIQTPTDTLLGILVILSNYMHILNSSFSIPTYYFKLMFYYYFLPKDMSRNATLRIISEYLLDKC